MGIETKQGRYFLPAKYSNYCWLMARPRQANGIIVQIETHPDTIGNHLKASIP
jgi:hypothetical protein